MYNLNENNFGENLKLFCKTRKISLVELGEKIGKAKSTMYKYASNDIIPDIYTVQEICNALEINLNQLLNLEAIENDENKAINPFEVNELFMYYIGFNSKMLTSCIKIKEEKGVQKVIFNNVLSKKDMNKSAFDYVGTLESDDRIAFIILKNDNSKNKKFEKVLITINLTYQSKNYYIGSITGTTDSNKPTTRKCVLVKERSIDRDELNEIFNILCVSEEEKEFINKNNFWDIETIDINDFASNE